MNPGRSIAIGFVVGLLATASGVHAESFYYYLENGEVVITNTPERTSAETATPARTRSTRKTSAATPFDAMIRAAAGEAGLSPELIQAVAHVESAFNPRAVSPKGAQGLMQLMPATAAHYGVTDAFDPQQSLSAGARHLRDLMDQFDGDLPLVLAAYNAGPTAVRRSGGVPAYRETLDYVRKVQMRLGLEPSTGTRRAAPARPVRLLRTADGSLLLSNE